CWALSAISLAFAAQRAAQQAADDAAAEAATAAEEAKLVSAVHEAHLAAEKAKKHAEEHKLRSYTVKKGDTLSEIGAHFKVDWREIAKINHVKNPDLIYPGQVFAIPND
uniref:LysM peptidoglycan-binding domain-containing protein n=1 Tax=Kineosporia sp. A_224 TaxID=1962180 RepID=UPI0018E935DF